ncbi:MAG: hypothetical protein QXV73_04045 [Candidatus Micrarchaeia archaeon]
MLRQRAWSKKQHGKVASHLLEATHRSSEPKENSNKRKERAIIIKQQSLKHNIYKFTKLIYNRKGVIFIAKLFEGLVCERVTKVFDPFGYGVNYVTDLASKQSSYLILCSTRRYSYEFRDKFNEYNIEGNYRRLSSYLEDIYHECTSIQDIINFFYDHTFYHNSTYLNKRNIIYQCYLNYCAEREKIKFPYPIHESYEKFKKIFQERKIIDDTELYLKCLNDNIEKKKIDTLIYINAEDLTETIINVINKLFDYKNLIIVGDSNRPNRYFFKPVVSMKNSNVNLSSVKVVPKIFANKIKKVATDFVYDIITNDNTAILKVKKYAEFKETVEHVTNQTDKSAKLILPSYDYQPQIEKLLFGLNIPFKTLSDNYKFPTQLYTFYNAVKKLVTNKGYVTKKEIYTIIDLVNPAISDRFGGKLKLKKMFYDYIYPSSLLKKMNFFQTLQKLYVNENLHYALTNKLSYEFVKWKGKLNEKYLNANMFVAPLLYAKTIPTDITVMIVDKQPQHYYKKMLYCCLTSTSEAIYVIKLPANWKD